MPSRGWRWTRRLALYPLVVLGLLVAGTWAFYTLTLYRPSEPQLGVLALEGGTVLAGPDLHPLEGATVVIEDGVITDVGTEVEIPADAEVLDLPGRTILPGLIDSHVHFGNPEMERGEDPGLLSQPKLIADWFRFQPDKRRTFLEHGVTSVRSMGDENGWAHDLRRMVRDGELEGPRVFIAGPIFTAPGGHPVATIGADAGSDFVRIPTTTSDARSQVRELVSGEDPVDLVKVVQDRGGAGVDVLEPIDVDILQTIVDEAHEHDTPVFAHWGTSQDLRELLAAGVDGLDHLEPRGVEDGWDPSLLEALTARGITLAPTLVVTDVALSQEKASVLRSRAREFHAAGGRVIAGSDAGVPGVHAGSGLVRELELLVEAGLTPHDVLVAATATAALSLGVDEIGVLAPGYAADLLVVDGDPLQDIAAIRSVDRVLRDGRVAVATEVGTP